MTTLFAGVFCANVARAQTPSATGPSAPSAQTPGSTAAPTGSAAPSSPSPSTAVPPTAGTAGAPGAPSAPPTASGAQEAVPGADDVAPTGTAQSAATATVDAERGTAPGTNPVATTETVAPTPVSPPVSSAVSRDSDTPVSPLSPDNAPSLDAATGPSIELAEEHVEVVPNDVESLSARRASASVFSSLPDENATTTIGGYAQLQLTSVRRGFDADFDTQATIRRLVLLFSHHITDKVAAYTELEWENAIACATCSGSVEIEQAYVDWQLWDDALTLRSGLVLIPMGLLNLWHEPPVFHGVDRPQLDQVLIPTTWRELGAGVTGLLSDNLEYQLYITTTLVPSRLGPNGLVAARQLGSNALSKAAALSGRVDYEPVLGLSFSGSFFASDAGANGDYFDAQGERVDFTFPIWGASLTARWNHRGWEARAVGAAFWMPEAGALMNARSAEGGLIFPNADRTGAVATRMLGGMVEVAYDVLRFADSSHQLLPFVRAETYDNQSQVPGAYRRNRALTVDEWTFGLSYRPIRQLVFKTDVQLRDRRAGLDELQINAGMGYML